MDRRDEARQAALTELERLYAVVDEALSGIGCDGSTDCCRFGVTGREPYPTAVELALVERALRARGGLPKRRTLPVAGERRCDLLSDAGRCVVYASRPFGCRTFFCERAQGSGGESLRTAYPKDVVTETGRDIAALSERFQPQDHGPRPLSRWSGASPGKKPRNRR